ncbi:MAG: choice-of-anchor D domain-containing protein [Verrucomicrobia bacterium]|nr:choice-of-anchor D domain-containing protein [Verrucomicrobiota bacterium]
MKTVYHIVSSFTLMTALATSGAAQYVQKWLSHYPPVLVDSSRSNAMAVDSAGNVIVTGRSNGPKVDHDIATIKYSGSTGTQLWVALHDSADHGHDEGHNITVDADDNVIVAGSCMHADGTYDGYIAKYDGATGSLLWEREYDQAGQDDQMLAVAIDSKGEVIGVGFGENASGGADLKVVKLDGGTGETLWDMIYDGEVHRRDIGFAVAIDAEDTIAVAAASEAAPTNLQTNHDFLTLRVSPAGAIVWMHRLDGPEHLTDHPYGIAIDSSGSIFVTGNSYSFTSNYDILTAKYQSPDFNLAWTRRVSGPTPSGGDTPAGIAIDPAGNVVVTGYIGTAVASDIYTAKYSGADGSVLWTTTHDGPAGQTDYGAAVAIDPTGEVFVVGASSKLNGAQVNADYYVARYAGADGALVWDQRYNGPGNRTDGMDFGSNIQHTRRIALTPDGGIVVTGFAGMSSSATPFSDTAMTTIKYGPPFHEIAVESPAGSPLVDGVSALDFGPVESGTQSADRVVTVRNLGDENLTGISVAIGGADAARFPADLSQVIPVLGPGASFTFTVRFEPIATGPAGASIQITSDDADENPFEITLSGTGFVAPDILVEDDTPQDLSQIGNTYIYAEWVDIGLTGSPVAFTIRNTGSAPLNLGTLTLAGADPGEFSLDTTGLDTTLGPAESTVFSLVFAPTSNGNKWATIVIPSDDPNESPYQIDVSAYSSPPPPSFEVTRGESQLYSGESSVTFNDTTVGSTSDTETITVTNTGTEPLAAMSVGIEGGETGDPDDFVLTVGAIPNPLPPGESFSFTVAFRPTASGFRHADVKILVNGDEENAFRFSVRGNGMEPEFVAYADWVLNAGLEGADAEPGASPFDDGVSNLLKYAFGMDWGGPDRTVLTEETGEAGLPYWSVRGEGSSRVLRVEFVRRKFVNLTYEPQVSAPLAPETFNPMAGTPSVTDINSEWERVIVEEPAPADTVPRLFGRMSVTLGPE